MFSKVLEFATEIPDKWLNRYMFKMHNKNKIIALENSIISCAKNKTNSKEKIERVAAKHN